MVTAQPLIDKAVTSVTAVTSDFDKEKIMNNFYDWEEAEALYGLGKSSREIERRLKIPHATVIRRVNSEKWVKGGLLPIIKMIVSLLKEMRQLTPYDFEAVLNESNIQLEQCGVKHDFGMDRFLRKHYYGYD